MKRHLHPRMSECLGCALPRPAWSGDDDSSEFVLEASRAFQPAPQQLKPSSDLSCELTVPVSAWHPTGWTLKPEFLQYLLTRLCLKLFPAVCY